MKTNWGIAIAALLIGAAGGYLTGRGGDEAKQDSSEDAALVTKSGRTGAGEMAESRAKSSRAGSIDDIQRKPGQMNRMEALLDYIAGLDPSQFEAEANRLDSLPWQQRMMSGFMLFSRWGEVDPLAAMDYASSMGFGGMFARPSILQSWASVDPENAALYYAENSDEFRMMGGRGPMGGSNGASTIAGEWARNDPEGAMKWAESLEGRDRSEAISAALREIAATDPAAAAAKLATLSGDDLGSSYREVARQWGAQDWSAAEAWVSTLPADEQGRALSAAIEGLAREDPLAAAGKIQAMPADQVDDDAVELAARGMARNDPAAAASWLAGLETDETRGAMREVVMSWTNNDPAAALSFIQEQPAGELRDTAASTYVWSNRSGDPQESMSVAETITDERSRSRAISTTARRWMEDDEAAATSYIQNMTVINDETKEQILSGESDRGRGPGGRGRGGR